MKNILYQESIVEIKHLFRMMRNTLLALFVFAGTAFATESYSQTMKVTVVADNVSTGKVISEIEKQTDYLFVYNVNEVNLKRNVKVNAQNKSVAEVLNKVFEGTDIYYAMEGKNIMLMSKAKDGEVAQQANKVTGIVKDTNGEPIIGANVTVKGQSIGTITDIDGRFVLDAPKDAVLQITYIGYVSQEVKVSGKKELNVVLKEDTETLDEVVVIGYGTAKKSDLTGATARADLSTLENSANVNLVQSLKGIVPGLNVGASTSAGGDPSFSIRGRNSISGSTTPLIVLDGIIYRGNLVDINTADIESIDVLKDASSTAIYGSQAANGVILITTKSVKKISKPVLEYNGSFSLQGSINNDMRSLSREDYLRQISDVYLSESRMGDDMLQMNPNFDPSRYFRDERATVGYLSDVNTDWYDLLSTPTPYIQNHNISIRGKSELSSYFVSFGFADQKNQVKNDTYKRYNVRINLDTQIKSWLKVGTQSFFAISDYSGQNISFRELYTTPSVVSPYNEKGEYETIYYMGNTNPLLSAKNPNTDIRYNLSANVYADVTIPWVKGLSYRLNYANGYTWYKKYTFDKYANSLTGKAYKDNSLLNEWTLDNIVTYKRDFGKHSVNGTFVYGVEKRVYEDTSATANQFTDSSLGYDNIGLGKSDLSKVGSSAWQETSLYTMLRAVYSYDDKYIFTGTIRRDGFSGFGEDNKFGYFPSIAAAWRISEEAFMDSFNWLDNLKMRVSYGSNGNRTSGRYSTMPTMSKGTGYVFGDGASPELLQSINRLANNNLKWETTTSTNIGFDFNVLNGRLWGTYDFYFSKTKDLLYDISVPQINGMKNSTIPTNIGKLKNRGHEFSITGIPVKTQNFQWTITGNFSTNKNEVETILGYDTNGDGKEDDLVSSNIFIGESLSAIYDYNITGMWQLEDYYNGIIPDGFTYGTYKVEDINKDGKISANHDRKIVGYTDPLYRFSLQNNFSYKNLELNVFINSVQGGSNHYLGQPLKDLWAPDALCMYSYFKFDYWTPENPNAKYRQLGNYTPALGQEFSPYVSRSFVRLQELSLAYNVPTHLLKRLHINRAKIYLSATNLFTLTDWDGWDPEANQGISYIFDGYPTMKTYTIGLNFEF